MRKEEERKECKGLEEVHKFKGSKKKGKEKLVHQKPVAEVYKVNERR